MGKTSENKDNAELDLSLNKQTEPEKCMSSDTKKESTTKDPAVLTLKRIHLTTKDTVTDETTAPTDRSSSGKSRLAANLCEQNPFTFKPKCTPKSLKIAEGLSSSFLSRQEDHIKSKKRYVSVQLFVSSTL